MLTFVMQVQDQVRCGKEKKYKVELYYTMSLYCALFHSINNAALVYRGLPVELAPFPSSVRYLFLCRPHRTLNSGDGKCSSPSGW
jgi:hypothetical protein